MVTRVECIMYFVKVLHSLDLLLVSISTTRQSYVVIVPILGGLVFSKWSSNGEQERKCFRYEFDVAFSRLKEDDTLFNELERALIDKLSDGSAFIQVHLVSVCFNNSFIKRFTWRSVQAVHVARLYGRCTQLSQGCNRVVLVTTRLFTRTFAGQNRTFYLFVVSPFTRRLWL